jgi:hypothetical protein
MKNDYCDAPSSSANIGVGALGAILTPSPMLGVPIGLIMRHYGDKDCNWWVKSAGTGLLVGSAIQVALIAVATAYTKIKMNQDQANIQHQRVGSSLPNI